MLSFSQTSKYKNGSLWVHVGGWAPHRGRPCHHSDRRRRAVRRPGSRAGGTSSRGVREGHTTHVVRRPQQPRGCTEAETEPQGPQGPPGMPGTHAGGATSGAASRLRERVSTMNNASTRTPPPTDAPCAPCAPCGSTTRSLLSIGTSRQTPDSGSSRARCQPPCMHRRSSTRNHDEPTNMEGLRRELAGRPHGSIGVLKPSKSPRSNSRQAVPYRRFGPRKIRRYLSRTLDKCSPVASRLLKYTILPGPKPTS